MNKVGALGEASAREYLISKGYEIVETNFTTKIGEVDIICVQFEKSQKLAKLFKKDIFSRIEKDTNALLVFVEVKSRENVKFGQPREAVDVLKQGKIKVVSEQFLIKHNLSEYKCRFDLIEVLDGKITHIIDAF